MAVFLAGAQDGRGKARFVRGVREELGFEREAVRLAVGAARRAVERAIQEVAGIELNAGLGGLHGQCAAGTGVRQERGTFEPVAIQHEVVVEAGGEADLLVVGAQPLADQLAEAEVERRASDRTKLAGGNERGIDRGEGIGIDLQAMRFDRSRSFALPG